jgi:hypothetical protein
MWIEVTVVICRIAEKQAHQSAAAVHVRGGKCWR